MPYLELPLALKQALLDTPLFHPMLLSIHTTPTARVTGLTMRVDDLAAYGADYAVGLRLVAYRHAPLDAWLFALAFRLHPPGAPELQGVAYLNPRHAVDREQLDDLGRQTYVPLLFNDATCVLSEAKSMEWPAVVRAQVREMIAECTTDAPLHTNPDDPVFQEARRAFERRHPLADLLPEDPEEA